MLRKAKSVAVSVMTACGALMLLASAARAQSTYQTLVLPGVGTVTLFEHYSVLGGFWNSVLEYRVYNSDGGSGMQVQLQLDALPTICCPLSDAPIAGTPENGATIVTGGGSRFFSDWYATNTDLIENVTPDLLLFPVISNSCTPLTPQGTYEGFPYWGSAFAENSFYFDTCAPDSFVDYTIDIPIGAHATLIGAPAAIAPEPETWMMLGSGFLILAGFRQRHRRLNH